MRQPEDFARHVTYVLCGAVLFLNPLRGYAFQFKQSYPSKLIEALYYTNIARAQIGLPGLRPSVGLEPAPEGTPWGSLQQAAFNHARDMAARNYFAHYTPEGWDPGLRLRGLGYGGPFAENIYCGSESAGDVVNEWMHSTPHRQAILNGRFSQVGIAHYYNSNSTCQHYWVMDLGS